MFPAVRRMRKPMDPARKGALPRHAGKAAEGETSAERLAAWSGGAGCRSPWSRDCRLALRGDRHGQRRLYSGRRSDALRPLSRKRKSWHRRAQWRGSARRPRTAARSDTPLPLNRRAGVTGKPAGISSLSLKPAYPLQNPLMRSPRVQDCCLARVKCSVRGLGDSPAPIQAPDRRAAHESTAPCWRGVPVRALNREGI